MKSKLFQQEYGYAILLMILCTIFTSLGQILWKYGVIKIDLADWLTVFNLPFVMGFLSYGIGAILILLAFKRGELSILYPIVATSYVWVSVVSPWLFPTDVMNGWKWAGVFIVLVSVSVLGWKGHVPEKVKTDG
mgnify:CR=1 FL=1